MRSRKTLNAQPHFDAVLEGTVTPTIVVLAPDRSASRTVSPSATALNGCGGSAGENREGERHARMSGGVAQVPSGVRTSQGKRGPGSPVVRIDAEPVANKGRHRLADPMVPLVGRLVDERAIRVGVSGPDVVGPGLSFLKTGVHDLKSLVGQRPAQRVTVMEVEALARRDQAANLLRPAVHAGQQHKAPRSKVACPSTSTAS